VYAGALAAATGKIEEFVRPELQNSGLVQDLEMQIHRIDEEGKWMSRPNMPLTNMQLDFLSRGRFGHGAVAILMQQQMSKIPDPAILSTYLHLRFPVENESNVKQKEHTRIANILIGLGMNKDTHFQEAKATLQQEHPLIWQEIIAFARNYEHTSSENMTAIVPTDTVLQQLLMTLGNETFEYNPIPLTPRQISQMDLLFAQNPDLARIMIMTHRHLYQKENEHHIIARAQHKIHQELLRLGQSLVERGQLKTPEQVFEPVAKPQFRPKSALLPPLPVPAQIAYAQSDMPICAERGLAPKSSDLCKKAGFATGSFDYTIEQVATMAEKKNPA